MFTLASCYLFFPFYHILRIRATEIFAPPPTRKDVFMKPNDFGLFCMDQAPITPEPIPEASFPAKVSLAMMYIPYQRFVHLYGDEKALERGTLFEELDLPFYGGKRGIAK